MSVDLAERSTAAEERSVQRFRSLAREVREAREFVASRLRIRDAPESVVDQFRLAVSELGANAVEHGDRSGWTVAVGASRNEWTMTVIGGSAGGGNPVLHPHEWSMAPPALGHGRGLAIVAALMDSIAVDVVVRRVRVRCSKRR